MEDTKEMVTVPIALFINLTFGWIFHRIVLLAFSQLVLYKLSPFRIGLVPLGFIPFARILYCIFNLKDETFDLPYKFNIFFLLFKFYPLFD